MLTPTSQMSRSSHTWELFLHGEVVLPEAGTGQVVEARHPQALVRSILQPARQLVADDRNATSRAGMSAGRQCGGGRLLLVTTLHPGWRHDARVVAQAVVERQTDPEWRHEAQCTRGDGETEEHESNDS